MLGSRRFFQPTQAGAKAPTACTPRPHVRSALRPAQATARDIEVSGPPGRREVLLGTVSLGVGLQLRHPATARADDFVTTASGLKYVDIRAGEGASPVPGDTVSVHWAGFTKGYQGKRIGNSSLKDEPFEFKLGGGEAIAAFEEAVAGMRIGGIRRVEVPGVHEELSFPRDRALRFTNQGAEALYKYRLGPQPSDLGGQRALDFVLDNDTLQPFNRDLLFDIKLLTVRHRG